jgi:hypothetical protein
MNVYLLLAFLLLPEVVLAQLFKSFESGSYILNDSRKVRQQGNLKLQSSSKLLVKNAAGETIKLTPEQVYSFWQGSKHYVTIGGFHVKGGLGGADVEMAFVEQLDSGRVILMRYDYNVGAPMTMGPTGGMSYGGSSSNSAYLLDGLYAGSVTVAQSGTYSNGGKQFREAVRPYLASRPDLVELLDNKRISTSNLQEAIHALNHNLPFNPPSALNVRLAN